LELILSVLAGAVLGAVLYHAFAKKVVVLWQRFMNWVRVKEKALKAKFNSTKKAIKLKVEVLKAKLRRKPKFVPPPPPTIRERIDAKVTPFWTSPRYTYRIVEDAKALDERGTRGHDLDCSAMAQCYRFLGTRS